MVRIRRKKVKMVPKHIELPREIIVGRNVLYQINNVAKKFDSALVVTGKKTAKIAGNKVQKLVKCDKVLVEKPTLEEVKKVQHELSTDKIDLAIAVGGGKIIDVTKAAAYKAGIEYISVPTMCSHDGIASPFSSIKKPNGGGSSSIQAESPLSIIADTRIIAKSPYRTIAAGVGDMIAKYSAVRDWRLGSIVKREYYGDYAGELGLMVATVVSDSVNEIRKRTERGINVLLEASISSGAAMGIAGSSRPASGSEHKISHALDIVADYPAMHGEQCGVATIIASYLQGQDWRRIKNVLQVAKCPTTAKELKVDRDIMLKAVLKAKDIRPERYTIIDHIDVTRRIAEDALSVTGIC